MPHSAQHRHRSVNPRFLFTYGTTCVQSNSAYLSPVPVLQDPSYLIQLPQEPTALLGQTKVKHSRAKTSFVTRTQQTVASVSVLLRADYQVRCFGSWLFVERRLRFLPFQNHVFLECYRGRIRLPHGGEQHLHETVDRVGVGRPTGTHVLLALILLLLSYTCLTTVTKESPQKVSPKRVTIYSKLRHR